jgi:hypothetical protein
MIICLAMGRDNFRLGSLGFRFTIVDSQLSNGS